MGRWAVGSTRSAAHVAGDSDDDDDNDESGLDSAPRPGKLRRQPSMDNKPGETADTPDLGVEIDVQIGQMTLRAKHLQALPSDIANNSEVRAMFGDSTIQTSILEKSSTRIVYQLVGLNHEIVHWVNGEERSPPLPDGWEREYDPAELANSERWIVNVSAHFSFRSPLRCIESRMSLPSHHRLIAILITMSSPW